MHHIKVGVPEGANREKRRAVLDSWYREELRGAASALIEGWQERLGVSVDRFFGYSSNA
ncbi:MAG: M48 family metallopeptidase [Hyphomicrobiales bacterium]|nr:M48 family metallopeptidase [Hyphomicrobiales bacterium]